MPAEICQLKDLDHITLKNCGWLPLNTLGWIELLYNNYDYSNSSSNDDRETGYAIPDILSLLYGNKNDDNEEEEKQDNSNKNNSDYHEKRYYIYNE